MSITRRTARRSVRILGVASASAALSLALSSTALACNIKDFKAEAGCTGNKGQITVTDTDASGTNATITVFEKTDAGETQVGQKDVQGSKEGTPVTFDVDWKASTTYRVHVFVKTGRYDIDRDIQPPLQTPSTACKTEESPSAPPSEKPSPSPSKSTPAESATPTPSASESSSAPAGKPSDNAPSPATGDSNLAETGANSNTGLIAGVAGALVVVGGGAVFFGMRRRGANSGR